LLNHSLNTLPLGAEYSSDSPVLAALCQLVGQAYQDLPAAQYRLLTALPWLSFIRFTHPTAMTGSMLEPSMCLVLQGGKTMLLGKDIINYGAGSYVLSALDMPISGQVAMASEQQPYMGIRLDFSNKEIADMIMDLQIEMPAGRTGANNAAYVDRADNDLQDTFLRLVRLLDKPQDLPILGRLLKQEIIYRLISSPQGSSFYHNIMAYYQGKGINQAIAWIKENFDQPLIIEQLAKRVGMSSSSLHHRFKAITLVSPLQYQKQIRLLEARKLLLAGNIDAASAAFQVGYDSPSQFSREYRRTFGAAPLQDINALKYSL